MTTLNGLVKTGFNWSKGLGLGQPKWTAIGHWPFWIFSIFEPSSFRPMNGARFQFHKSAYFKIKFSKWILSRMIFLTRCQMRAPSAWPFRGNIIGFSRFWRNLVIFVQEIYIKTNVRLSKNTYVFEPSFSDIYFTGWFFYYLIFLINFTVTCI